ncbi:MAG: hypothetical protein ACREBO_04295 [Novosphingobium sp.]
MADPGAHQLWRAESFADYAELCRRKGYCSPWHPYVGPQYGKTDHLTFAYCGGAAWWNSDSDEAASLGESQRLTVEFVVGELESYSTPFWRLFDRLGGLVHSGGLSRQDVLARSAWTNLSKTGAVGRSAPPDGDIELRQHDVRQLHREFDLLRPDILICVSGSLVPSTGHAVFDAWDEVRDLRPETESTWIRRSPWGGLLLWTMHPAYKPDTWSASIESDVRKMLALLHGSVVQ